MAAAVAVAAPATTGEHFGRRRQAEDTDCRSTAQIALSSAQLKRDRKGVEHRAHVVGEYIGRLTTLTAKAQCRYFFHPPG